MTSQPERKSEPKMLCLITVLCAYNGGYMKTLVIDFKRLGSNYLAVPGGQSAMMPNG